jgi:hypothetical protein
MSIALQSDSELESNKDAYDAEFDGSADLTSSRESDGSSQLCVDKETSCIYTN